MSVFQKLFVHKNGKKSSKQFGIFGRKNRQAPAVIELPVKDTKVRPSEDDAIFVAMPPADVRLVLFQEHGDTSDRKLLFNSKSYEFQKTTTPDEFSNHSMLQHGSINNNGRGYINNKPSYQYVRGPHDSEILSEMLFGTVGMASRASSLKIHLMKEPHRLMLSRVFCVETAKETPSLERGIDNQRPIISVLSRRKAKTLPVPTPEPPYLPPPPQSLASSLTSRITRSDSSSSLLSLTSILGASLGATGSLGSRSMPQQIPSNRAHSLPPAARQASRDSFTLTHEPHNRISSRRTKVKIGFAVIFQPEPTNTSEFQRFFFEHFPLIESYLTLLKEQVESALNNSKRTKPGFVENMMEALGVFALRINAIYSTPRLPKPVWSSLTTVTSQRLPWQGDDITITCFIADLARMVTQNNTKHKNFFMTGLVTSVLTHHLGWVNTMIPPSGDAKTLAYNPLWAQLGDLYGAVGTPTKVAKTVVLGEIHELVSTIISILSYFIRCSDVTEVVDVLSDMTPQAFIEDTDSLKMSLVPSDLENDYVYISVNDDLAKIENNESALNDSQKLEKKKFLFCRKSKVCAKKLELASVEVPVVCELSPSPSSSLCRSRSSPGTTPKPTLKIWRQKSSGYEENLPAMRVRTNSNDTFGKPRGVQSRRTSHEMNTRIMSKSSSALTIPPCEQNINTVSSLEGSKSYCTGPTSTSDLLRKRLGNENVGSCPNVQEQEKNQTPATRGQQKTLHHLPPIPKTRTHKRVSSEPFNVNKLRAKLDAMSSSSLVKTYSTDVVEQTFVDAIEPRIVNVALVQRSQHVVAMQSPISSPQLPRSKSSAGQKGPILGFKTSDITDIRRFRVKHKSGSFLKDNSLKMAAYEQTDVIATSVSNSNNVRRSSSNLSQGGVVRRSSSNNSGKMKLAGRRHRLSTKTSSFDDDLPPLTSIPSVTMEHDDFDEYFEDSEYITFSTPVSQKQSSVTQNHSTVDKSVERSAESKLNNAKKCPPPLPSLGPCHVTLTKNQSSMIETKSCMTELINRNTGNRSSVSKLPPPLPSVGPCHRTLSAKPQNFADIPTSTLKPTPPPLPAAPPATRGSLYPRLDTSAPTSGAYLPKSSIYPSLSENVSNTARSTGLYPKLEEKTNNNLYPKLPAPSSDIPSVKFSPQNVCKETTEQTDSDKFFSAHKVIPLCSVVQRTDVFNKKSTTSEEKSHRLNFGDLMADYSPEYLWGFALHGTQNQPGVHRNIIAELQHSISRPVLDEPVAEAVTIVADTDKWSVKVLSSHRINSDKTALPVLNSKLVQNILERITKLYQINAPAQFCMQQLESSLGELVLKSRMIAGYLNGNTRVPMTQLSAVLGIESSDLPLLMSIASCHSPQVAAILL